MCQLTTVDVTADASRMNGMEWNDLALLSFTAQQNVSMLSTCAVQCWAVSCLPFPSLSEEGMEEVRHGACSVRNHALEKGMVRPWKVGAEDGWRREWIGIGLIT